MSDNVAIKCYFVTHTWSGCQSNTIIIELFNKQGGYSAVVEVTLEISSGSLNSRTHQGPWAVEPSNGFQEVVTGKRKALTLW